MSDCTIPAGVNARIIDEPSCLIESDGKKYIQFSKREASDVPGTMLVREERRMGDNPPQTVEVVKEKKMDVYSGGDVNGDGIKDKAIVTTVEPETVETKVYFGQKQGEVIYPATTTAVVNDNVKKDTFTDSTKVFKSLDKGRSTYLPFSFSRNLSSSQMYKSTYPVESDQSILWVSVPEDPKAPK